MINILIVGVGGQGTLLASRILGAYYAADGLDVKLSEVHGMSQRGGSVVTFVRAGERVDSPIIGVAGADIIVSFELIEALRYLPYLKKGGKVITSTQQIDPMPVITGKASYPGNARELFAAAGVETVYVDALAKAEALGNAKCANVVILGAVSAALGGDQGKWESAVEACVPERFRELNLKAFAAGRDQ